MAVQKAIGSLNSINDVFSILDTSCVDCVKISYPGAYTSVRVENNHAIFQCSFVSCEYRWNINFATSGNDIEQLIPEINDVLEKKKTGMGESKRGCEDFYRTARNVSKKLSIYVQFASPDLALGFKGYCAGCSKEMPVVIENQELWDLCCDCSTIRIDSMD